MTSLKQSVKSFVRKNIKEPAENFFIETIKGEGRTRQKFEDRTRNFERSQQANLAQIIQENKSTNWGMDHAFDFIDWEDMPITTYDDVMPYVDMIRNGNFNALTSTAPVALAVTSGTTAEPKFVPLTPASITSQNNAATVWKNFIRKQGGIGNMDRILILSGGSKQNHQELLPVKSYTNVVTEHEPSYIKKRKIFPKELKHIEGLEKRLLIAAQQAIMTPPTALVSVNPMTIVRFLDLTKERADDIKNAINEGRYIGTDQPIPKIKNKDEVLARIENPLESVNFITTWLGGTQYLFIDELKRRGINIPMRDLGYMATEGRFTIPIENNTPRGVLNPFENFYEFMELDEEGKNEGKREVIPLKDLKEGKEYNIVITSPNGLYRYDIQDVIKVEGWYNDAPMISFQRKNACFSSMIGEKLHENHAVELLKHLELKHGILKAENELSHVYYSLNIPASDGSFDNKEADEYLKSINPEYAEKRTSSRLGQLVINNLSESQFAHIHNQLNPNKEHDRYKEKFIAPLLLEK